MNLARELIELLGPDIVRTDPETLATHATDRWFASHAPAVVVLAQSTEQVRKLLVFAHEHQIPVTPRGAGVGYVGGCVPAQGGIALSLARMNRIKEIHFADAIAVVEPGVITGTLQAEARQQRLFYPPDPASLNECSLGGNIATNAGGPRCLKYGVTRQYVVGLEVVLANGEVLRTGGRTHKNKTGFDLISLFVGSEGLAGGREKSALGRPAALLTPYRPPRRRRGIVVVGTRASLRVCSSLAPCHPAQSVLARGAWVFQQTPRLARFAPEAKPRAIKSRR